MPSRGLRSIMVRDFRSISGEWTIPLDANVVLIHGQNGAGKTSLLSALELAATGRISHLDRIGDSNYLKHLNHRGTKAGQVRLETFGLKEQNSGTAIVAHNGIECQPLLDSRLAEAFVERCFLPQATLGRLFEIYAPNSNKSAETPLIRFVKAVLGLDPLEALIDGLYPAADVRRIEKVSSGWQRANRRADELHRLRREAVEARGVAENRVGALTAELTTHLDMTDGQMDSIFAAVDELAAASTEHDAMSARLREIQLRLDAVESALVKEGLLGVDPMQRVSKSGLETAEARYREWLTTSAGPLLRWFEASQEQRTAVGLQPATMLRALRSELRDAETAMTELRRQMATIRDVDEKLALTRDELKDVDHKLHEVTEARRTASTSSAAASLASVLMSALEHIDGEVCPVCDQQFRRAGSLRNHILGKADALNVDAERLLGLESRRSALSSQHRSLTSDLAELVTRRKQLIGSAELHAALQAQTTHLGELSSLESVAEAGQLLADELGRSRDAEATSTRNRSLMERCLADLDEVAAILGTASPHGLLAQRLAAIRAISRADLQEVEGHQRHVVDVLRKRTALAVAVEMLQQAEERVTALQLTLEAVQPQIEEARRRKEVASQLRKEAEALRTATITRVFDEHLNGSWARIFGALVPSENFVPQFKRIPEGLRKVTVELETVHRDGLEAATPAAMLSQGNLNTAALSLFVALHFAVPAELPWLIFDDPVQSMDDLHISNFASMVKQLTRRNDRQVIIAVHERELFDYLALELTPASPKEELLTVILDRTYDRSVISSTRVGYSEDTALASPSAA